MNQFNSANYSNQGFQNWLYQQGIQTSFTGNKIVAKSVLVYRLNSGKLSGSGTIIDATTYESPTNLSPQGLDCNFSTEWSVAADGPRCSAECRGPSD